jgi:hypothetical protein
MFRYIGSALLHGLVLKLVYKYKYLPKAFDTTYLNPDRRICNSSQIFWLKFCHLEECWGTIS